MGQVVEDPIVERLSRFFRDHPAWRGAAALVDERATSRILFTHRPGEQWRLLRAGGETVLEQGRAEDPDLAFRFSPGAVERITEVEGGVGEFAVALFSAALDEDPMRRVDVRILASFRRLVRRGYLRLLLAGGAPVLKFGAKHRILSVRQLAELVSQLQASDPQEWEAE